MIRRTAWVLVFASSACGDREEPLPAARTQPVIYGEDGRNELEDVEDDALRAVSSMAVAAIIPRARLRFVGREVELVAQSLAQMHGVCAEERFADQPSAAVCSGVLLGDRTLLTAGHCMRRLRCDEIAIVFGYQLEQGVAPTRFAAADVFGCTETLVRELSLPAAALRADFAWVRLDRSAAGRRSPIELRASDQPLRVGEPVAVVGFASGLPLKVALGGGVLDARPDALDYFVTDSDTFHGDSGGPVFDAQGRLLGIHVRGNDDYVPGSRGCTVAARLYAAAPAAAEENTYAERAVSGLCAAHPEEALCCVQARGSAREQSNAVHCRFAPARCGAMAGVGGAARWAPASFVLCSALLALTARRRVWKRTGRSRQSK